MRRFTIGSLALAFTLLSACADFKEILVLQQGLAREFQTSTVGVNLNNSAYLTVTFSNSTAADLPEVERAAFARRVAEYVRDHYAAYDKLQSIQVGFSSVRGGGVVHVTSTQIPYRFTPSELGAPKPSKNDSLRRAALRAIAELRA